MDRSEVTCHMFVCFTRVSLQVLRTHGVVSATLASVHPQLYFFSICNRAESSVHIVVWETGNDFYDAPLLNRSELDCLFCRVGSFLALVSVNFGAFV